MNSIFANKKLANIDKFLRSIVPKKNEFVSELSNDLKLNS